MSESASQAAAHETRQYATFSLDGMFFGVEVRKVQEVLLCQPMTPVPLAPAVISGLINLRGQIVTAIDLRRRLGLEPRPSGQPPLNVVIRTEDGGVSLLVDEIGDVLEAGPELYEPPPDNMPQKQREMVEGVYKMEGRLLLALNTDAVLGIEHGLRFQKAAGWSSEDGTT